VIEGSFGLRLHTQAERARIAAESLMRGGVGYGCCASARDNARIDLWLAKEAADGAACRAREHGGPADVCRAGPRELRCRAV